jgi:hypothetical protein
VSRLVAREWTILAPKSAVARDIKGFKSAAAQAGAACSLFNTQLFAKVHFLTVAEKTEGVYSVL